jgi:hypothetical protein
VSATVIDNPILNSPFAEPARHWVLDDNGIPTGVPAEGRRRSEYNVPVPPPRHRVNQQAELGLEDAYGERKPNDYVNEIRTRMRQLRAVEAGQVFPATAGEANTDRARLRRGLSQLAVGNVLMVTQLDRLSARPGNCSTPSPRSLTARPVSSPAATPWPTQRPPAMSDRC